MSKETSKISVITVCYNAAKTISDTLLSVQLQTYSNVEHVIVDGHSTDNTVQIAQKFQRLDLVVVSEPDEGLYDAMNKGIRVASGEIVIFLNADDYLASPTVLTEAAEAFENARADCLFGNVLMIGSADDPRVFRHIKTSRFERLALRMGSMPPHPASFFRRQCLLEIGGFDTSYTIGSDFELLVRLFKVNGLVCRRLGKTITVMRVGGISTQGISSTRLINKEILRALRSNDSWSHPLLIWSKYLLKWTQLFTGQKVPLHPTLWDTEADEYLRERP